MSLKTRRIPNFSKGYSTLPRFLDITKAKKLDFGPPCHKVHTEELKEGDSHGFYSFYISEESDHLFAGGPITWMACDVKQQGDKRSTPEAVQHNLMQNLLFCSEMKHFRCIKIKIIP